MSKGGISCVKYVLLIGMLAGAGPLPRLAKGRNGPGWSAGISTAETQNS